MINVIKIKGVWGVWVGDNYERKQDKLITCSKSWYTTSVSKSLSEKVYL